MNSVPSTRPRSGWRRFLIWFCALMAGSALILGLIVLSAVSLARDAGALRDALVAALPQSPTTRVQVSAGPALLGLARFGLQWVDQIPDEGRLALRAVRSASVGVYTLSTRKTPLAGSRLLAAADQCMNARGWTRLVAVIEHQQTVMIYTPGKQRSSGVQKFCLAVCDADQLVVVSGAADLDVLLELVERQSRLASL